MNFKRVCNYLFFKRLFDLIFSYIFLIIFSPLIILISLLIFTTSSGGIIYKQKRLGLNGEEFNCLKFRTMFKGSEYKLQNLLRKNKAFNKEFKEKNKLLDDPRITSFGKLLRKSSLDEIPQFINVIRGDMSVIGPRPIQKDELERYDKFDAKLLSVKPGITGLWQVNGRSRVSYEERVLIDMAYIENISLSKDLIIFLLTILVMLKPFSSKNSGY